MTRLVPMEPADFDSYLNLTIREYAEDNVRIGRWSAQEAIDESRKQIQDLLPSGLATPNHFVFSIVSEATDEKIGAIWLAIEPRGGFVYDLKVLEPFRRQGHAERAMRLVEQVARGRGVQKLSLQVFGDNRGARDLYAKLGYSEMAVMMSKPLPP
jgi:ribosomal protein S18 acetylase RimI-like enzyme